MVLRLATQFFCPKMVMGIFQFHIVHLFKLGNNISDMQVPHSLQSLYKADGCVRPFSIWLLAVFLASSASSQGTFCAT